MGALVGPVWSPPTRALIHAPMRNPCTPDRRPCRRVHRGWAAPADPECLRRLDLVERQLAGQVIGRIRKLQRAPSSRHGQHRPRPGGHDPEGTARLSVPMAGLGIGAYWALATPQAGW